jgi:Ca2+-binding RTX toxin-like protein
MSNRFAYGLMVRELTYFGAAEGDAGWDPKGFNWIVGEHGHKVAVVNLQNKLIHVLTAVNGVLGQVDDVIDQAAAKTLTAQSLAVIAAKGPSFSWTIDLSKDAVYKQALLLDPFLDQDAANFSVWMNGMVEGANSLLRTNKLPPDLATVFGFAGNPRTHLFANAAMTVNDDSIMISSADLNNADNTNEVLVVVDGGEGYNTLSFTDELQKRLGTKVGVNIDMSLGLANFVLSTGLNVEVEFSSIQAVVGTNLNDVLRGTSGRDAFDPGLGADQVYGKGGGHSGALSNKDRVSYWGDVGKGIVVTADVTKRDNTWVPYAKVLDAGGATDDLYDISLVVGTMMADTYNGDLGRSKNAYSKASEADKLLNGIKDYRGEFAGYGGADIVNGNNLTRVSYVYDPNPVTVNLGSTTVLSDSGIKVGPGTALDGFGSVDKLNNVTGIRGSDHSDRIFMSVGHDVVTGEQGDDYLFGDRGNDDIWGSSGRDTLVGGAGFDLLFGDGFLEELTTAVDQDVFAFQKIGDAAGSRAIVGYTENDVAVRVGDVIADFQVGTDLIDLSAIDASTRKRGDQAFTIRFDDAYSSAPRVPGELLVVDGSLILSTTPGKTNYTQYASDFRLKSDTAPNYLANDPVYGNAYEQDGVYLVGDVQGDGRTDFAIFLMGVTAADLDNSPKPWLVA